MGLSDIIYRIGISHYHSHIEYLEIFALPPTYAAICCCTCFRWLNILFINWDYWLSGILELLRFFRVKLGCWASCRPSV